MDTTKDQIQHDTTEKAFDAMPEYYKELWFLKFPGMHTHDEFLSIELTAITRK
jgi:hypothetical protein